MQARTFWSWFRAHEAQYRALDRNDPALEARLDALQQALQAGFPALWFETGTGADGIHELVISADGNADAFDDVRALVAAAPAIPGWRVNAFRQGEGEHAHLCLEGVEFAASAAWFRHAIVGNNRYPTLQIGHAHFDATRRGLFQIGSTLLLQAMFGEELAGEALACFDVAGVPECPQDAGWQPLAALATLLHDEDDCSECTGTCATMVAQRH